MVSDKKRLQETNELLDGAWQAIARIVGVIGSSNPALLAKIEDALDAEYRKAQSSGDMARQNKCFFALRDFKGAVKEHLYAPDAG